MNMGGKNGDVGFYPGGEGRVNFPSSTMSTSSSERVIGVATNSMFTYKSPIGGESVFPSGWDPIVSLSQSSDTFGGSSMICSTDFANSSYHGALQNHEISSTSQFVQYTTDSGFIEGVSKLPSFGSGSFMEMVGSFGQPEMSQFASTGCPPNYAPNKAGENDTTSIGGAQSQEGSIAGSPNGNRRKWAIDSTSPNTNVEGKLQKNVYAESSEVLIEQDGKRLKIEENSSVNLCGKQAVKNPKDSSNSGDDSKEDYIHVRARRGQATNSHSLAERVRREKISERMRLLQELVPGCNKITGKAVMLDEIINYVQSLQQQVEFLSMKLAAVNPELNIDLERNLAKEILHSRGVAALAFGPGMRSQNYPHGSFQGTLSGISSMTPHYSSLPRTVLDNELRSLFQIGFDSNSTIDTLDPNGSLQKFI